MKTSPKQFAEDPVVMVELAVVVPPELCLLELDPALVGIPLTESTKKIRLVTLAPLWSPVLEFGELPLDVSKLDSMTGMGKTPDLLLYWMNKS